MVQEICIRVFTKMTKNSIQNIRIKFDVLPTDELGSVLLVFLYGEDWENDNVKQGYVSSLQAYAITGDYNDNDDNPLPYPFVGDLKLYKKLLTTSFFGNMWKKNSDALGGIHSSWRIFGTLPTECM